MDWLLIVLRIVHVGSAMAWFGGAFIGSFFLFPAAQALGPAGQPFMDYLTKRRRMGVYFPIVATLAIVSGATLYWRDSSGLASAWISSPSGLAFAIGGLAAIVAFVGGLILVGPSVAEQTAVRNELAARYRHAERHPTRTSRAGRSTDATRHSDRPAADPRGGADDGDRSVSLNGCRAAGATEPGVVHPISEAATSPSS